MSGIDVRYKDRKAYVPAARSKKYKKLDSNLHVHVGALLGAFTGRWTALDRKALRGWESAVNALEMELV